MWLTATIIVLALGLLAWATTRKNKFAHWAQIVLMLVCCGFVFPNALLDD